MRNPILTTVFPLFATMFIKPQTLILQAILMCGYLSHVVAQKRDSKWIDSTIIVQADPRIDSLIARHVRINEMKDGFDGWRVQIFSGSGNEARQAANNMRVDFLAMYPEIPAYLIYQAPNFKVRVGDFRTELDAIHMQRQLAYQFPGGFVVKDLVKFPKLEIEGGENRID